MKKKKLTFAILVNESMKVPFRFEKYRGTIIALPILLTGIILGFGVVTYMPLIVGMSSEKAQPILQPTIVPTAIVYKGPSERALKAVNYAYEDQTGSNKDILILKSFGNGSTNIQYALRNWAIYLDNNLQELIRVETLIEKSKAEHSRPIYNEQPAQIIQQQMPAQQNNSVHCTSQSVGGSTYTNCY
jgi:hypothetical protein